MPSSRCRASRRARLAHDPSRARWRSPLGPIEVVRGPLRPLPEWHLHGFYPSRLPTPWGLRTRRRGSCAHDVRETSRRRERHTSRSPMFPTSGSDRVVLAGDHPGRTWRRADDLIGAVRARIRVRYPRERRPPAHARRRTDSPARCRGVGPTTETTYGADDVYPGAGHRQRRRAVAPRCPRAGCRISLQCHDLRLTGTHVGCEHMFAARVHSASRPAGALPVNDVRRAGHRARPDDGGGLRHDRRDGDPSSKPHGNATVSNVVSAQPGFITTITAYLGMRTPPQREEEAREAVSGNPAGAPDIEHRHVGPSAAEVMKRRAGGAAMTTKLFGARCSAVRIRAW